MNGGIRWFTANPAVANLLMVGLLLAGALAIPHTRQETLPNVPLDRIGIYVGYPQATPETVEALVCTPLENAVDDVEGGTELISEAREGLCTVQLDVLEGYDTAQVLEQIRTRMDALDTLPQGASRPRVRELIVRNRVARLLLSGNVPRADLYRLAQDARRQLLAGEAVSSVDIENLPAREMVASVRRDDLYRYDLSLSEIAAAAGDGARRVAGGLLRAGDGEWMLETGDQPRDAAAYGRLVIRQSEDGDLLRLGDVATIDDGFSRDTMAAWLDGEPAVALDVYRTGGQNVLDVAKAVKTWMDSADLPAGVSLTLWRDDARQFRDRSDLLWRNGLQGLVLLTLLLGVFLTLRLAGWVALGIPVCMLGACAVLPLLGESFNTISLFAFMLVLGIVVDDAVIVGESVDRCRRQGLQGREAAVTGALRVARPLLFAVLTTLVAFAPLLFLPGPEGALMRVIPIVAIAILLLSLVESLWILPAHLVSQRPARGWIARSEALAGRVNDGLELWLSRQVQPLLRACLRWRYVVILGFVGLFLFCVALVHSGWLTMVLFSRVQGDRVVAEAVFPQGTGEERLRREVTALDESARRLAAKLADGDSGMRVTRVFSEQGVRRKVSNARDPGARYRVRVSLALEHDEGTALRPRRVAALWRDLHGTVPDALSLKFHANLMTVKPDIHINLFHPDLERLQTLSDRLALTLERMNGVHEVANSTRARRTVVDIELREEGRLAGLDTERLGAQVRDAFHGVQLDHWFEQDREVPVMLRLAESDSRRLRDLERLPVRLPNGDVTLLGAVAKVHRHPSPATIGHYDTRRNATVSAYVDEKVTSPARVMAALRASVLDPMRAEDPSADWAVAGKPASIERFLDRLSLGYLLALCCIFFLLTVLFGGYGQPLLVMMAIPFGLVGAFLGHFLLGYSLTLWSLVGVIAVSGVVVNDNLVLIDGINARREEGLPFMDAVVEGASERLRPILLTSLTTFAGVAPLMLETSAQARFLIPMAVALAFGVLFATLVSLLLVPCLLVAGRDLRRAGRARPAPVEAGG